MERDCLVLSIDELPLPNSSQSLGKREVLAFLSSEGIIDAPKPEGEIDGDLHNKPLGDFRRVGESESECKKCEQINLGEFPFVGGKVLEKPALSYFKNLEIGDSVVAFLPFCRRDHVIVLSGRRISVPEKYVVPIPKNVTLREATVTAGSALFTVNALFEKGKLQESEIVLILNGGGSNMAYLLWQIVVKLMKGKVFIVCRDSEEFTFLRKVGEVCEGSIILQTEEIVGQIREETGGRGVDLIIDLELKHDTEEKRTAISCLAPGGRWFVTDCNFQLDPPELKQLFCKNSSVVFGFEEVMAFFSTELGKAYNMIEFMVNLLAKNQIQVFIEHKFSTIEEYREGRKGNQKFLGSGIISLGKQAPN